MKVFYEKPDPKLVERRNSWGTAKQNFLKIARKEEAFYYSNVEETGTIFTKKQLEQIGEGSGIPVSINFLYPIINQKLAILVKTKPSFKVTHITQSAKEYSYILDKGIKSIMYSSSAVGEKEECIKNMLIMGIGIDGIEESEFKDIGNLGIDYVNYHPSLVTLDADAKKRSLKDMRGYFIEKEIDVIEGAEKYKAIIEEINRLNLAEKPIDFKHFAGTSLANIEPLGRITDSYYLDKVSVAEYFEKVYSTAIFYKDPDGNIKITFKENLSELEEVVLVNVVGSQYGKFVKKSLFFGNYKVAEEIQFKRDYGINAKFFEWGGKPYSSFGVVHYVLGMQDAADRAIQSMLVNGMLTNNAGYTSPKGGVAEEDKPKWESFGNKPGVMKEWVPTVISGQLMKPEREVIQPLSNFYPTIIEMMKNGMQFSSGITDVLTGDSAAANIDVFSSLQQYQSTAMQRIQLAMSHINVADEQLGNVMIDALIESLDPDVTYTFFDEKNKLDEISVAKELLANVKTARYKVLAIPSDAMPTQKMAMSIELMKIAQTSTDPYDRNIYMEHGFELSGIQGFDEVKEKIDTKNKLVQQVNSLQEQLDRIQEINVQLENRVINAELKARISDAVKNVEVEEAKAKEKIKTESKNSVDKN